MALKNEPINKKVDLKGLRTQDESFEVGFDGMVTADNVDYTRKGKVGRRPGRADTTYVPGGTIHSAWADKRLFIFQEGTTLKKFRAATDVTTLRTGLTTGGKLSAYRVANTVYWSNEFDTGVIDIEGNDRALGVAVPDRAFAVAISGNLAAGRYSHTFSQVETDGRESGSPQPVTTELAENSGLSFTLTPGLARRFWLSETNGDTLYLAGTVLAGASSFTYENRQPLTNIALDRMLQGPPPAWQDVDWFRASLLLGVNDNLLWTNEYNYELVDLATRFMPFGERIHVIAGLEDGFYVGTENAHFWLSGTDMSSLALTQVADYGAVPGTKTRINGTVVGTGEATEPLPVWTTHAGVVVGLPGGQLKNIHEKIVDFPNASVNGTALYRKTGKQNHYISVINGV